MESMVRLTRIYTRGGDDGSTGLADGTRVSKDDLRIEAYGTVDELNSVLGFAARLAEEVDPTRILGPLLARVQNDLFDLGADLATPGKSEGLRVSASQIRWLEKQIDRQNAELAPLDSFVLPGGSELSCWLHLGRTVCRRAERLAVRLRARDPLNPQVLPYLNRLSDLLFVLARGANDGGQGDVLWVPGRHRD